MDLTRVCLLLLVSLLGAALANKREAFFMEDTNGKENDDFDDEDEADQAKRSFELNMNKAKTLHRGRRWAIKWGTSSAEECREGCSREELEENGMHGTQIRDYMKNYNCKRMRCSGGSVCGLGRSQDWSHNRRLKVYCNRNGRWSSWSSWTSCSKSCAGGTRSRKRYCNNPSPMAYGRKCSGSSVQIYRCNTQPCPINGGYTYSVWSKCSKSCGGGTQTKTGRCINPVPKYGGKPCAAPSVISRACNTQPCPVHGGWSDWTATAPCSKPCGGGTQTFTRKCNNPAPANRGRNCSPSESTKTEVCNTQPCPVDGGWSDYSEWTPCSASCGGGSQERTRECDNPQPENGGQVCTGTAKETRECNNTPCPVNGGWGDWTEFSACSVSCGGGTKSRSRTCDNPAPLNGGADCIGESTDEENCNTDPCPVDGGLSDWGPWTECSVSCGTGSKTRTKTCTNPEPENGGKPCVEIPIETEECNEAPCESADMKQGMLESNVDSETCKLGYIKMPKTQADKSSAGPEEAQESEEKCKELCSNVANCMGYNWDESDSPYRDTRCWLKNVEFVAIDEVDYYHKRIRPGKSVSSFMKYTNFHMEGAIGDSAIQTVEDCAKKCIDNEGCVGFDYNRKVKPWKDTRCWQHVNEVKDWAKGNHFLKVPCPLHKTPEP